MTKFISSQCYKTSAQNVLYTNSGEFVLRMNSEPFDKIYLGITDKNYKKTKFMQFGLHIPVNIFVNLNRNIYLFAGVYGDWFLKQHSKIKFPKDKISMHGTNPFQFGAQFSLGLRNVYMTGTYSFTKLFEKGRGPEINPASIGIGFWL